MKRCLTILCILTLLAALCGCGSGGTGAQGEMLRLFYPAGEESARGGDMIESVAISWEEQKGHEAAQQAHRAVELLLEGSPEKGRSSPVPKDTKLQECSVSGGVAQLDFSEQYGQLSGMELSMADYCITLTLSQISGIRMVRITVDGQELAYRDKNIFSPEDVLLTSAEDVARTLTVRLFFPDASGVLTEEARVLTLYEGENQADVLLAALAEGPESEKLSLLLPEGFTCRTVRQEDGVCYVELPRENEALLPESREKQERLLWGITDSLCSLEGVEQVQFLKDGELRPEFGQVDISRPFQPK